MRSPWKLIKDLASRRKVEEASGPVDEIVAKPGPRAEEHRPDLTLRAELEAAIESKSTVDENEASGQRESAGAAAELSTRVEQSDPLLAEPAESGALEGHDQPLPATPVIQAAEGETGADVLAEGPKKQRAKAPRARKNRGEQPVVKKVAEEPPAVEKTFLDEATELDLEIKGLRSQLSTKLLEQNAHLRRMLERYNDK
ncbi:hypothetical protein ACLJYM_27065 [Rhizobium giardinii]|uniref:hypothetical protein n=1 Tax=Rhizobium giardinii TaxID=56731 RepID=UPI0039E0933A